MDENLAILVKVYQDLLAYFPNKIKPTILEYNGEYIKIVRKGEASVPCIYEPEEPYKLTIYSVFSDKVSNRRIGEIAIYEDKPGVGFFPYENK